VWVEYIVSAFILGIVVAIPPGSVTIIAIQRILQFGFLNSLIFSLGSASADIFYIILVYNGVAGIFASNPLFKIILWFICSAILIFLGTTSLWTLRKSVESPIQKNITSGKTATFISGIMVTLTNPITIVGWLAIAGNFFLVWSSRFPESKRLGSIIALPIMAGVLLYFIPLLYAVSRLKSRLNRKTTGIMIIIGNIFLLGFGCYSLYNALHEILRQQS
jgi:L-lysine exporter family protein LysE/ArgO